MEKSTFYDDQYIIPELSRPKFEDDFEILNETSGGMGDVFFCKEKRSGKLFALKKAKADPKFQQLFKQEAAFVLELGKHPNLVHTYTIGRKEDEYYIVMELVESARSQPQDRPRGNTLLHEFNRRQDGIDAKLAFRWAIAFCEGMAYLNAHGMKAHKDIKPDNIFITPDGTLKIGDFGLAGLRGAKAAGTRGYRAPEVKNGDFDVYSDIYAFGVVLYQLFNKGHNLTETTCYTSAGTTMDATGEVFPTPQDIRSHYAQEIIQKCLALKPQARYASFKKLQQDLIRALQQIDTAYTYQAPAEAEMQAEDYFQRGNGWNNLGNYEKAIKLYDKTLELDSQLTNTYNNRGRAYVGLEQYDKAIADYNKTIEREPQNACAYYNCGSAYHKLKQYDKAIAKYSKAIEVDPHYTSAYNNRGLVYDHLKQYHNAIADYNKAIELAPKLAIVYNNRGIVYNKLKQYDKAIADYSKAIGLNSQHTNAYYNRGIAYYNSKQYDNAIADYNKAIELAPQYTNAYNNRGNAYNELKQYDKAIADYSKAIGLNSQYTNAYYNRGVAYANLKQYNNAIANFAKVIELDTTDPEGYDGLIKLYKKLNQPEQVAEIQTLKDKNCPAD